LSSRKLLVSVIFAALAASAEIAQVAVSADDAPNISPFISPSAILELARMATVSVPAKRSKVAGLFETNDDAGVFHCVWTLG